MGERYTGRKALGMGLVCLGMVGVVLGLIATGRAGWGLDALEVVGVLVPVGLYLTLKGLGWDLALEARLWWARRQGEGSDEDPGC